MAPLAWSGYMAIPVAGWGWIDGLPLGPIEAGAVALIWWAWATNRALPGVRALAVLTIAKFVLGALLVEGGMAARYYANATWTPPVEQSIEFRRDDITRRDERMAFGGNQPDLPLYFFNDLRFNFYTASEPDRDRLPYSVVWNGFLRGRGTTERKTFYLAAQEGIMGVIALDGREILALDGAMERTAPVELPPGWHRITIQLADPVGLRRELEAGEIVDGVRRPFSGRQILVGPVGSLRMAADAVLRWVARGLDLVVLSWLAAIVAMRATAAWRMVSLGRLFWLAAIFEALRHSSPYAGAVVILSGGEDWLSYEHLARAIALGDPMLWAPGKAAGQGTAFYYQPLYPYFVALTHLVFGDGIFGVALVQRLLLAATVGWVAAMTRRLLGVAAGWVAFIGGGLFLYIQGGRWTDVLLAEPLFLPLMAGWTWLLVRAATEPASQGRLIVAGVVGGLATLTRSTLLLGWPLVLPVWWASLRARRVRAIAVVVATMIAVVATATLRNWVVSSTIVPVTTSFGINLYIGNEPPRPIAPAPPERAAVYERLQLAEYTRTVIEYAVQAPDEFVRNLTRKAVYTVGFFEQSGIPRAVGTSWLYVAMWCAALAGTSRILRARSPHPAAVLFLPGVVALSHFAAVVLIFPHVYGDRLILPLYPLLIPYAAFATEPVVVWIRRFA